MVSTGSSLSKSLVKSVDFISSVSEGTQLSPRARFGFEPVKSIDLVGSFPKKWECWYDKYASGVNSSSYPHCG